MNQTTLPAQGPVDVNVGRQRDRHMMSRYEYGTDRLEFRRWHTAPGPCRHPYWRFDELGDRLTIELHKGERVMRYDLTTAEMETARLGWRWLVAQAVRMVRHALTPNVEVQGREAALAPRSVHLERPVGRKES